MYVCTKHIYEPEKCHASKEWCAKSSPILTKHLLYVKQSNIFKNVSKLTSYFRGHQDPLDCKVCWIKSDNTNNTTQDFNTWGIKYLKYAKLHIYILRANQNNRHLKVSKIICKVWKICYNASIRDEPVMNVNKFQEII